MYWTIWRKYYIFNTTILFFWLILNQEIKVVSKDSISSLCGIQVESERLYIVTNILFLGAFSTQLIFLLKSEESSTRDLKFWTCVCKWWSIYSQVWQYIHSMTLTELMTGFPVLQSLWFFANILNCLITSKHFKFFADFLWRRRDIFNSPIVILTF